MKLYFARGTCALAPHIIVHELGLPHEPIAVDLYTKKMRDGADFRTVNPLGYVPALELDDGDVLVEVTAILQYLGDLVPEAQLVPPNGSRERYHLQSRLNFIATELHKSYSVLHDRRFSTETKLIFRDKLHGRLQAFEQMLSDQLYIMPQSFGVADAYAYTVINWSRNLGVDVPTRVQAYVDHIHARVSVQTAREAERAAH